MAAPLRLRFYFLQLPLNVLHHDEPRFRCRRSLRLRQLRNFSDARLSRAYLGLAQRYRLVEALE